MIGMLWKDSQEKESFKEKRLSDVAKTEIEFFLSQISVHRRVRSKVYKCYH